MKTIIRPCNPFPAVKGAVNILWVQEGHARAFFAGKEVNLPTSVPMRDKKGRG